MALFSLHSEHFENWAFFRPLVQILITSSHWKAFGPTKAYTYRSEPQYSSPFKFYQLILLEKTFRQSPGYLDMPCTATDYVPQPLLSSCCWPTVLSVLGRLPAFPLRIKSLLWTLWRQQTALQWLWKFPATSCHKPRKPSILKTNWHKTENNDIKVFLLFKQTVASCASSKHMVFSSISMYSKLTYKQSNTID